MHNARDSTGNISQPEAFAIMGVGVIRINAESIRIFPNPTNTLISINIKATGLHYVEITSLNGQLIFRKELEGPTHQLDLSSFQKGVYLITVRSMDQVWKEKIIKLK